MKVTIMLAKSVAAAWVSIVVCMYPLLANDNRELDQIDKLLSSGRIEQALNEIDRLRKALPVPERLTAWELDFRGEVWRVAHGRNCIYYLLHLSNSHKDAPGRQGVLDSVSANLQRSDLQFAVVCVDLKTGQIRWSRAVNGHVHLAVDPCNDVLYLYRKRLLALAPDSGKVLEEHEPPKDQRKIQGLLLGQVLEIPQPFGSQKIAPDARLSLYAPSSKLTKEVSVADYWLLAPDESKRLVSTDRGWECESVPDGQKKWSYEIPFNSASFPLWHEGSPIFILGTEQQRGAVTSIDLSTGKVRWSAALGWGSYGSNMHQLSGGGCPDKWIPLTAINDYLLTVDGSGRLYFIAPANGNIVAEPRLSRNLLAMPFQHDGQLIVTSFKGIRSYSLANLIKPDVSLDAALQIRKARCLLALGRRKDAMELLDKLLERSPQLESGWLERAEVCKAMNDAEEEAYCRCMALSLSGRMIDNDLRDRWGLLRLYNLKGKPCWTLAQVDGKMYVGTLAGDLWSVQASSLDIGLIASLNHEVASLETSKDLLAMLGNSIQTKLPVPKEPANPDDRIPREWHTIGGGIGQAISYRGRQFRAMKGGGVRVLSGTEITDLPPRLDDIAKWNIHMDPFGPLGYGAGVFELDDDLRPTRWLIRPLVGGERPERTKVMFMQSTPETIGLVMSSSKGAVLQVYSRQGVLLNETTLGRFVSGRAVSEQFIPMGNGYLFSDRQLVWISSAADHRVWKFGPSLSQTSTERWGDRWRFFGDPLLVNGCLYVTGLDGNLYIFDSNRVTDIGA